MNLKLFLLLIFSSIGICPVFSQSKTSSSITIGKTPEAKFSFTKNWGYKWNILKHNDGKFENIYGKQIQPADTAHLYHTANCQTNVQGGYNLSYCNATKKDGTIELIFTGGQPAYGSEYKVSLKNNKIYFDPDIVYEEIIENATMAYKITKSKLIFNQKSYNTAQALSGYINIEFNEVASLPKRKPVIHQYHLRGYFKTPVKSE